MLAAAAGIAAATMWYLWPWKRRRFTAVALDMDGTMLRSDHQLAPATVDCLRELSARGVTVIIATGRDTGGIVPYVEQLELAQGMVPCVSYNGSHGFECTPVPRAINRAPAAVDGTRPTTATTSTTTTATTSPIFTTGLPPTDAMDLVRFAEKIGCTVQWYDPVAGAIHAVCKSAVHDKNMKRYEALVGHPQHRLDDYSDYNTLPAPAKMLLLRDSAEGGPRSILQEAQRLGFPLTERYHTILSSPPQEFFVEVLVPGVNKGAGLERMCRHLGIDIAEVVSFGDGDNDREFLQVSGQGHAMKNATPMAREAANVALEWTNDEDGVAKQLHRLVAQGLL